MYLDLQVGKLAYPAATQNWFFGVQIAEDVHPGLFHHGEQLGIVLGPLHVPHVLALELELLAVDLLAADVDHVRVQVEESENSEIVDDRQPCGGTVETHHVRTSLEGVPERVVGR